LDHLHSSRRLGLWLILIVLLLAGRAEAKGKSDTWARTQFTAVERMRASLAQRPSAERTRHDYQRVIAGYRQIYLDAPNSSKADPSAVAVAELLVEMGRHFDDDDILRSAIHQYEFLRREYPGSRYRFEALFTIGEIYKDDLDDPTQARPVFAEFLRRYPRHHLADDARAALTDPVQPASLTVKQKRKTGVLHDLSSSEPEQQTQQKNRGPIKISSIRHWSTPDYARVAIDLDGEVKFDSRQMDHPNRIAVDLLGTKLNSALLGKDIDVEDGFVKKIRASQFQGGKSTVVLEIQDSAEYKASLLANPPRVIIDIQKPQLTNSQGKSPPSAKEGQDGPDGVDRRSLASVEDRTAVQGKPKKRMVEDDEDSNREPADRQEGSAKTKTASTISTPQAAPASPTARASTKTAGSSQPRTKRQPGIMGASTREARPTARGDRSLIRALGLKIGKIVIDPGHGGHDTGTIGPKGLEEKDLVLEVGRRLGNVLQARLGAEVIYTRTDDTFVPLETRTAIANQERADLFVSIHANSSRDPEARGVETYYLNFTSSSEALEVAGRENATSDKSIHELQELVKTIALKEKIEESREFAADVQRSLHSGLASRNPGIRDRGVKRAPFVVLIGANMPSILAEISFVSNPGDERRLRTADYRQRIAESLYRGIARYVSGLSGVKVASRMEKSEGQ
jgi:N-acetylmuramoyl-L-alanine amidase